MIVVEDWCCSRPNVFCVRAEGYSFLIALHSREEQTVQTLRRALMDMLCLSKIVNQCMLNLCISTFFHKPSN